MENDSVFLDNFMHFANELYLHLNIANITITIKKTTCVHHECHLNFYLRDNICTHSGMGTFLSPFAFIPSLETYPFHCGSDLISRKTFYMILILYIYKECQFWIDDYVVEPFDEKQKTKHNTNTHTNGKQRNCDVVLMFMEVSHPRRRLM